MAGLAALGFGAAVTIGESGADRGTQAGRISAAGGAGAPGLSAESSLNGTALSGSENSRGFSHSEGGGNAPVQSSVDPSGLPGAVPSSGPVAQLPDNLAPFGGAIGGSFDLIDHFGNARQLEDYRGKHVMIFFGYANCLAICSAALPLMGETIDLLGEEAGKNIVPLMITVDPKNDTPEFMRKKLAEYHPALIGMTGSEGALADVRSKFQVRTEFMGEDIDGKPIYNHGSYIYLLGPDGKFETLVPPILGPEQMAKIIGKYLAKA